MERNTPATQNPNWGFVIPLEEAALESAQKLCGLEFSPMFLDFLKRTNNAIPPKRNFYIGQENYTFKNVLNFNMEGKCTFAFFMQKLKAHLEAQEIFFGSDGYGGLFILDTASDQVLFLDTDTGVKKPLLSFDLLLKKLES
ncbi:SMI1/KNR4 family protein [Helicobacter gastrocanis]|uniref:SMI1/KNR4 family protein n=1 Tax=Helicobacter gastrocanis TaxID=2849641 RepID=UPI001C8533B7|nr:SMI1/KNR4 family protein [Helicobacter sp. NHP19-003]